MRQTAPLHAAQIAFELPARLRLHRDVAAVVIADLEAGVVQPPDLVPVQEPGSDDRDQRLSLNMKLLGSVDKFFYRDVAGIRPLAPGFRRIAVAPKVTGSLRSAAAEIRTVRGPAAVAWRRERGRLRLSAAIPANAAAEVRLPTPGGQPALVTEGGRPVWRRGAFVPGAPGVTAARAGDGCVVVEVGAGAYDLTLAAAGLGSEAPGR